jgi:hypothetical protein
MLEASTPFEIGQRNRSIIIILETDRQTDGQTDGMHKIGTSTPSV